MGHSCEVVTATTQPLWAATIAAQAVTTWLHRPTPDTDRQTDRHKNIVMHKASLQRGLKSDEIISKTE